MIITKTPYRISFFGGGTDRPEWYKEYGGRVLATTFNKYCYISVRKLPQFFEHKHRIVYSVIESVRHIDEIQHPSVREILKYFNCDVGLEIHHDGVLPARSGLGSSSSFSVGLINAINALEGVYKSPIELAKSSIYIEQEVIKECVGSQDQISAAYGGFTAIEFYNDGAFSVTPKIIKQSRKKDLNNHLMLFYTGVSRFSSKISKSLVNNMKNCSSQMQELYDMAGEGSDILSNDNTPLDEFGFLMNKAWQNKRTLSSEVSNKKIDELYNSAIKSGALGGKILGAGGGGFILFFVKPENQLNVKKTLKNFTHVPFSFENTGSEIIVNKPN